MVGYSGLCGMRLVRGQLEFGEQIVLAYLSTVEYVTVTANEMISDQQVRCMFLVGPSGAKIPMKAASGCSPGLIISISVFSLTSPHPAFASPRRFVSPALPIALTIVCAGSGEPGDARAVRCKSPVECALSWNVVIKIWPASNRSPDSSQLSAASHNGLRMFD
jgi:hypothetical protein